MFALRNLLNSRGAIALQTMVVLPILLLLLFGSTEMFIYYFDLEVVNAALDQSFRKAQLDGYFSAEAQAIAERELAHGFMLRDYELKGTSELSMWGDTIEITFSTQRSFYIASFVQFNFMRRREGFSEFWPAPSP